jgi:hypothetical protein
MLRCAEKRESQSSTEPTYSVDSIFVDFDGKKLAYKALKREVQYFIGAVNITSLPFYPLQYHKDEAQIRRSLVYRGAKFVSLQGIHHKSFTGIAFQLIRGKNETILHSREEQSRVMLDPVGFRKVYPEAFKITDLPIQYTNCDEILNDGERPQSLMDMLSTQAVENNQHDLGSDMKVIIGSPSSLNTPTKSQCVKREKLKMSKNNLLLICSPVIVGYSFASLEWFEFDVRGITDIQWNEKAWDSLVLNEKLKELIKASVSSRVFNSPSGVNNELAKKKGLTSE